MSIEQGMPNQGEQPIFSDEKRRAQELAALKASDTKVTPEAVQPGETMQQAADRHSTEAVIHEAHAEMYRKQGSDGMAHREDFEALFNHAQAEAVKNDNAESDTGNR